MRKLLILCLLLSGCATSHEVIEPTKSRFGPVDQSQRGVVKYLAQGMDSIVRARREDAMETMYENCHGKYRILQEAMQADGSGSMAVPMSSGGWMAFSNSQKYVYIQYECVE